MKLKLSLLIVFLAVFQSNFAQQWGGSGNLNGTIFRNGNVGIGTNSLSAKLHLNALERKAFRIYREGSTSKYLSIWHGTGGAVIEPIRTDGTKSILYLGGYDNPTDVFIAGKGGKVGIGANNLAAKLHLNALERKAFRIYREGSISKYLSIWHGTGGAVIEPIRTNGSKSILYLGGYDNPTDVFIARKGGKVGIGTTNLGSYKLAVNGKIRAKEVVVETGWSDFVFEDDYDLPNLKEVESFIESNGHLKDIPSAKEVAENGIKVGEIESKLLQKIEELTLYTIQQEKKIKRIEEENKSLKDLTKMVFEIQKDLKKLND